MSSEVTDNCAFGSSHVYVPASDSCRSSIVSSNLFSSCITLSLYRGPKISLMSFPTNITFCDLLSGARYCICISPGEDSLLQTNLAVFPTIKASLAGFIGRFANEPVYNIKVISDFALILFFFNLAMSHCKSWQCKDRKINVSAVISVLSTFDQSYCLLQTKLKVLNIISVLFYMEIWFVKQYIYIYI